MSRLALLSGLFVVALALNGCLGGCPNEFADADSLIVEGRIPEFAGYRPCGGTDGECWAIGEAIVTYADGTVKSWTETLGRREFFIRNAGSFGSAARTGEFALNLHEPMGDAFTEENQVLSIRYLIELVDRHSQGTPISIRTGVCFEGTVQSENVLSVEQDPFILPGERDSCDLSQRTALEVAAEFVRSENCPR